MVRRYEDPVEVRPAADGERPGSFLWQGRLYVVREVLGHWRERQAWWASAAARAVHGDGDEQAHGPRGAPAPEREVWRVEASRGRVHGIGVFDLCCEDRADAWRLVRVAD